MQKLYYKSTQERRKKFQIYTSIIEDDGKKYAIKEPVFTEGQAHIQDIYHNYEILKKVQGSMLVPCERIRESVRFPFVEGIVFDTYLRNIICEYGYGKETQEVLELWEEILIGDEQNIAVFDNNINFQKAFGNGVEILGDRALQITNFDCIAENIIMNDAGKHLIDYEWVFDFSIPLEFSFYRLLKVFYLKNRESISFESLLKAAQIENRNKIELYEKMLDSFYAYVTYDEDNNVDYANLGKVYKTGRILEAGGDAKLKYVFPKELVAEGTNIILYGAGDVGLSYYQYICTNNKWKLSVWVDKQYEQYMQQGLNVCPIEKIFTSEFDYIVIAIYNDKVAHEIIDWLEKKNVDRKKIIWQKPQYV